MYVLWTLKKLLTEQKEVMELRLKKKEINVLVKTVMILYAGAMTSVIVDS